MELHFLFSNEDYYFTDGLVRLDLCRYMKLRLEKSGFEVFFFERMEEKERRKILFRESNWKKYAMVIRVDDFYRTFSGEEGKKNLYDLMRRRNTADIILITAPLDEEYSWGCLSDPWGVFQSEFFPEICSVFRRRDSRSVYEILLSEYGERYHILEAHTKTNIQNMLLYWYIIDHPEKRLDREKLTQSLEELRPLFERAEASVFPGRIPKKYMVKELYHSITEGTYKASESCDTENIREKIIKMQGQADEMERNLSTILAGLQEEIYFASGREKENPHLRDAVQAQRLEAYCEAGEIEKRIIEIQGRLTELKTWESQAEKFSPERERIAGILKQLEKEQIALSENLNQKEFRIEL